MFGFCMLDDDGRLSIGPFDDSAWKVPCLKPQWLSVVETLVLDISGGCGIIMELRFPTMTIIWWKRLFGPS